MSTETGTTLTQEQSVILELLAITKILGSRIDLLVKRVNALEEQQLKLETNQNATKVPHLQKTNDSVQPP